MTVQIAAAWDSEVTSARALSTRNASKNAVKESSHSAALRQPCNECDSDRDSDEALHRVRSQLGAQVRACM
jgi:hypothetical protein